MTPPAGATDERRPEFSGSAYMAAVAAGLLAAFPSASAMVALVELLQGALSPDHIGSVVQRSAWLVLALMIQDGFLMALLAFPFALVLAAPFALPLIGLLNRRGRRHLPLFLLAGVAAVLAGAVALAAFLALLGPHLFAPTLLASLYFLPAGAVAGLTYWAILLREQRRASLNKAMPMKGVGS